MLSGCGASRTGLTTAFDLDPGAQKSSTSCPRSTSASHSSATTDSIPPYPGGGTGIHGGARIAILSGLSSVCGDDSISGSVPEPGPRQTGTPLKGAKSGKIGV